MMHKIQWSLNQSKSQYQNLRMTWAMDLQETLEAKFQIFQSKTSPSKSFYRQQSQLKSWW